jgi:gamma-D-glutamyl-L-lysine dipeptidyl-peptidase
MVESLGEHTFARQLAPLRAEPAEDAEQVTQALPGEPLRVLEELGDWARVETACAYPGWARREDLGGDSDPDWLRPFAADPVEHARTLLGTRYEWGGMTSAGIDCSGLVHMSFRACGLLVPRDADQQEEAGELLSEADVRPGDLVTYGPPEGADHIAFWVRGGRILHATGREGTDRVVEEQEPPELRERCRALVRLGRGADPSGGRYISPLAWSRPEPFAGS